MISASRPSRLNFAAYLLVSFVCLAVAASPAALAQAPAPQPTADIPPSITTPDAVETNLGTLLEATDHTNAILEAIREMGFKTALDDFGTRYSSLAYLCNFKFDKIKIDRSFVSKISKVDTSRTIVQSVVKLGRALGMDIVAEGVETELEAVMMTRFGCTELQGFYFSKAISADDMAELLETFQPKRLTPMHVNG